MNEAGSMLASERPSELLRAGHHDRDLDLLMQRRELHDLRLRERVSCGQRHVHTTTGGKGVPGARVCSSYCIDLIGCEAYHALLR